MNGGIGDIFWIFMMLSMLQPWLRQKMLEAARIRLMHRIERQRGNASQQEPAPDHAGFTRT